jgi:phage/plasmid-associated DNA primase
MGAEATLMAHAPDNRVLAEHVVPFAYETNAKPERFLRYLDEVFAEADAEDRAERIRFLREHLGASLLGQGARYHRHPVLVGPGGNGKSVFLLIVEALFPETCRATSPPHTWGDRFGRSQLHRLCGKRSASVRERSASVQR